MTDHDTMKRIFATTVPDANGRAVSPEHRASAGGGAFSSSLPPSAHYIQQSYKRHLGGAFYEVNGELKYNWPTFNDYSRPSMQYTPSGAFDWEKPMTAQKAIAWMLMGAGFVVGLVFGAHVVLSMLMGG